MLYHYDFRYAITRRISKIALRLNFRKMVFIGKEEHVSNKRPLIFTPNHRNALIDALLLVYASSCRKQVVFLARADIFKKKFAAWIIKGMRIMPVFRIRDGKDNLKKNNEIFNNAARILKKNNTLALFPEGVHNPKQSLLPIRKAVPRIVLPTEASEHFTLNSQIVPVSIYYRDISQILSDVYVTFGTPIDVVNYEELYNENPVQAINALRNEMEQRLRSMVVNIQNDAYYEEYQHAIDWNGDRVAKELFAGRKDDFLQASLHIVERLDQLFEENRSEFELQMEGYKHAYRLMKAEGLKSTDRIWEPLSAGCLNRRKVGLLLSAPIALLGYLNSILVIWTQRKLQTLFKDKQFVSSVRYASGLIFVPLYTLLQSLIIRLITGTWIPTIVYFILMPTTFYFSSIGVNGGDN